MIGSRNAIMIGVLLVMVAIISFINPVFYSYANILDLMKAHVVLALCSLGMLLVMLSGNIDISISALIPVISVVLGNTLVHGSSSKLIALLVAVGVGMALSLCNGTLIALTKTPGIIVTLATMNAFFGIMLWLTNGTWIVGLPQSFVDWGDTAILGSVPIQVVYLLAISAAMYALLQYTRFGRNLYAIGGNKNTAVRMGVHVGKVVVAAFVVHGFLAGVAAYLHTSIVKQVDPNAFIGFEMQVISAVVLGGVHVNGGHGNVLGVLLGVLFIAILNNGMTLMYIPNLWQKIVIGLFMLVAVSVNNWYLTRMKQRRPKIEVRE